MQDVLNLLSATDIAIIFLDDDLCVQLCTPQVGALFDIQPGDRGRPLHDLPHRLGDDSVLTDAQQVLDRVKPTHRELQVTDGRWYQTRIRPYHRADERIGGVVITFVDITERKNSELSLRESEERFRLLVDTSAQIVWSTAANGEVMEDSPSWRVYTGQTFQQFQGTGWADAVAPEDREWVQAQWRHSVATGEPLHTEFRVFHTESGEHRWTEVRAGALRAPDGTIRGWVGMNIDIHEHKIAEQSLQEINETLEARVEERTLQVRQLASKLTMAEQKERRRVSQILHDNLQQLLYGLQMKTRMLEEQLEAAGQRELAEAVIGTRAWLQEAIETTRQLTVDLSPPILKNEGLADAIGWLKRQMQQLHGLEVELETLNPPFTPNENLRVLLFQVVRELLFNIKKHANVDRARVELDQADERILIRVSDSGQGFTSQVMEDGHGSGFGLVSVRERLRLLGGDMEIDSAPGEGTTILIWVPATPSWQ
ncbi:PAS domain-containing sensor histidine kinase [Billgrantia bachuensis]|uniref:Oxygen sensor histidine kinase NreB n=1 Tax=Billgrantia bachuensis TaxID=2717286 RepID=A0ABX0PPS9_9GAMM|nr:PAS domain-containing protein [Halomonas bachuensis]NIC04247.1 PAS domain S-box protein [Halomonas bachuensis]